ncbi:hypothetical protein Ple7327_0136 [Pleurocapsa sp. PCC 7327]|uniref:helix-turn-helix domain-containing protein n=1 Tax=Pleurocapsa sp. PCC 7327 TaxID=118163 RepID=UPI00029FEFA0|nr:RodZ domain-containing protein [Pleurocapsa sp. PCC 7327]AFY75620.1 hypothetical protein Ple7327_0136 [Pleurocapsa sp. PCC 7327]
MFAKFKKKSPPKTPQQERQEKLAEIGSQLAQIRTEKGISLKLIETKTQIPVRLLHAIETGNLNSLPEPVYIRGLIKQFADALGLDGTEIANTFPIDLKLERRNSRFRLRLPSWQFQLRPFHLYLLYILLVVLSVRGIANVLRQSAPEIAIAPQPVAQPSPTAKNTPKATKTAPAPKQPQTKPVVVDLKINELSWLEIRADGKRVFQGNLPKGTQRTWTANQQIIVRAGNAGGVLVKFNDEPPKLLGQLGQVQTVTYQAKPAPASR